VYSFDNTGKSSEAMSTFSGESCDHI